MDQDEVTKIHLVDEDNKVRGTITDKNAIITLLSESEMIKLLRDPEAFSNHLKAINGALRFPVYKLTATDDQVKSIVGFLNNNSRILKNVNKKDFKEEMSLLLKKAFQLPDDVIKGMFSTDDEIQKFLSKYKFYGERGYRMYPFPNETEKMSRSEFKRWLGKDAISKLAKNKSRREMMNVSERRRLQNDMNDGIYNGWNNETNARFIRRMFKEKNNENNDENENNENNDWKNNENNEYYKNYKRQGPFIIRGGIKIKTRSKKYKQKQHKTRKHK